MNKILTFLLASVTLTLALAKVLAGLLKPILLANGVDAPVIGRLVQDTALLLNGAAVPTEWDVDRSDAAQGGVEIARGLLTFFRVTLPDDRLAALLGQVGTRLNPPAAA